MSGLPAETVAELPGILKTVTGNVDTRRPAIHTAAETVSREIAADGGTLVGAWR